MGYILPIQLDTYTQYVNRTIPAKNDYAQVPATATILLNNQYIEEERRQDQQRFSQILDTYKKRDDVRKNPSSKYTGKGKLFNEYV
ncbi:hypothetical protein ACFFIX_10590 [Metabacillus herbersteinensis]|uniref:Uncharacterized protein n=1 Tax=Metabacillus herbersteinensis TaxID=283816 RepID=A0ABV6GDY6_9BACI